VEAEVPYMPSVSNLSKILDAIQKAGAPDAFGLDFLKDLGFTSSNDRAAIKLLKFLGLLETSGKPTTAYKEFMDQNRSKAVLAVRLRKAYDDLFLSDKEAHTQSVDKLKGWFKTKTGAGDAVAKKIATTFKSLASYADFSQAGPASVEPSAPPPVPPPSGSEALVDSGTPKVDMTLGGIPPGLGFVYRIEIHLPDTTNIETYRSIFRAIREELQS
jgi:Family of unknown function (DUF5343)